MSRLMIRLRPPQAPRPTKINREIAKPDDEHSGISSCRTRNHEIAIAEIVDLKSEFSDLTLSVWDLNFGFGEVPLLQMELLRG
jgi:hypothetical protein